MLLSIVFSVLFVAVSAFPDAKAVAEMSPNPPIPLPLGMVQGSTMKSRLGKIIFAFRGLPYAKPPVGALRFKPPEPVEKWNGTFDATKEGLACLQDVVDPTSEDCLLLNVYSTALPKGDNNPKRPVIVYFHPGGFYALSGQSMWVGPQYLMDKEIVLVTPNYRLASLGFLSTGDKESPGNNGLKDQVQVLRWVKENIESFGGDPDLVTIAGCSAGGASVSLHMVSPMSRGLFHRAIAMSGSAIGNWPIEKNQLKLVEKQARILSCPDTNSTEILKCLKAKPAEEFKTSVTSFREFGSDPKLIWLPVIEPDFGQERFLIEDPTETILNGQQAQVPLMTGITAEEFSRSAFEVLSNSTLLEEMNKDFERLAPIIFIYERDTDKSKDISKALKQFYFGSKPINNSSLTSLTQIYSDGLVGFSTNRLANLVAVANINPVYYYKFAYKGRFSHFYLPDTENTPYGAVHMDDLMYLFYNSKFSCPLFKESDAESKIIDHMINMWSNFARTGNPTPEAPEVWKRMTADSKKYLIIDEILTMEEKMYNDRYSEWERLFPSKDRVKHGRHFNHNHGFHG